MAMTKEQRAAYFAKYRKENKEARNAYDAKYRAKNKEYFAKYREENKEALNAYAAKYREENKEARNAYDAKYREENKEYYAKWREENKAAIKAYYVENKRAINARTAKWRAARLKIDPIFKTARLLRNRTWAILKNKKFSRSQSSSEYLGCSFEQLKTHLEAQFQPGMTWENQGQWHIDHIIPLASAKTIEEVYALCHYSNLQPLWAAENISKGAKVPDRY